MQKLFFILAVTALIFSSCGSTETKHSEGTHAHDDGTIHEAHAEEAPAQKAFEVSSGCAGCTKDSCDVKSEEKPAEKQTEEHKHEAGHDHDHTHE